jgi:hypothetical protein
LRQLATTKVESSKAADEDEEQTMSVGSETMSQELLYFNGINGTTGAYGLPPMTPQALADQIQDSSFAETLRLKELEDKLKQVTANTKTLVDIVGLLAKRQALELAGEAVPASDWLKTFARDLTETILGKQYVEPGNVLELENKLRQDLVSTLGKIVKLLADKSNSELSAFLLNKEPDNSTDLKEKLKDDTKHKIADMQRKRLDKSNAQALANDAPSRTAWLDAVTRELKELPIESLRQIKDVSNVVTAPLDKLVKALQMLPVDEQTSWPQALIADLQRLAQSSSTSWPQVIDTWRAGSSALTSDVGDRVNWSGFFHALDEWLEELSREVGHLAVVAWVDPKRLDQAGWGIIFPAKMDANRREAIKAKLTPLLNLRQQKAGDYYQVYEGGNGYRPDETASAFLQRYGARSSDPADPDKVPYYLLLVGSPEEIPFQFQYQLDVQYAVGRIDLGDDLEAYANYASSVVAAEQSEFAQPLQIAFFGTQNPNDAPTEASAKYLVEPLYQHFTDKARAGLSWQIDKISPKDAKKVRLLNLLKENPPALLFTASHGLEFDGAEVDKQRQFQGALICGEWDGKPGKVPPECYLSGKDIREAGDLNLRGMIAFFFACYGAGTPRYDEYYKQAFKKQGKVIAEHPFVADLPKAMLSLSKGGALAVVAHVERAWMTSFLAESPSKTPVSKARQSEHIAVFESALERLLEGHPIGAAMEYFNIRYAALSTELTALMDAPTDPNPYDLAEKWTANNDARGYIVLGDPAVRLYATPTDK